VLLLALGAPAAQAAPRPQSQVRACARTAIRRCRASRSRRCTVITASAAAARCSPGDRA